MRVKVLKKASPSPRLGRKHASSLFLWSVDQPIIGLDLRSSHPVTKMPFQVWLNLKHAHAHCSHCTWTVVSWLASHFSCSVNAVGICRLDMWPCGRRRTRLHVAGPRETRPLLSADEEKERKRCDLRARLRDRRPKGEGREERSHSGEQQQ